MLAALLPHGHCCDEKPSRCGAASSCRYWLTKDVRAGAFGSSPEPHTVELAVAQDVIVNGYAITRAGDLAEGHYATETNQTKRTFEANVSQELTLDIDDIVKFCGDTLHVQFERTFAGVFGCGGILKASTDRFEKSVCAEATMAESPPLPRSLEYSDAPRVDGPLKTPPLSMDQR
jgi:hypothetical protein